MSVLDFLKKPVKNVIGTKLPPLKIPEKKINPVSLDSSMSGDANILLKGSQNQAKGPKVSALDVIKEIPGQTKEFLKNTGQASMRAFGGLASAITGKDFTPEGTFQQELYGTNKPINITKTGRELRLADPEKESKGGFKILDPVLGIVSGSLDAFPTGGQMKKILGLGRGIKETIAVSKDATEIAQLLKKEVPNLTEDVASAFAKVFKDIDNVQDVDAALNRITVKMQEKARAARSTPPNKSQSPLDFISKPVQEVVPSVIPKTPEKSITSILSKPVQEVVQTAKTVGTAKVGDQELDIKKGGIIAPKEDSLATEAKKYKSAEEFDGAIRSKIDPIIKLAGNEIEDIKIIGSTAEGKLKPNDTDILVSLKNKRSPTDSSNIHPRKEFNEMIEKEIKDLFPNRVHVTIADYDPARGKGFSLTDFYNKVTKAEVLPKKRNEGISPNFETPKPPVSKGRQTFKTQALNKHIEEDNLNKMAEAVKNKDLTDDQISNLSLQLAFADEALDSLAASDLRKYVSRATGRLPEVTGKPTRKSLSGDGKDVKNSHFGQKGDQIVKDLGFKDTTEAQEALDAYIKHKDRVSDIRQSLRDSRANKSLAQKGEKLMNIAMSERRSRFKNLKQRFDLSDKELADLRDKQDLSAMTDKEFQDFLVQAEIRASELETRRDARIQVEGTIHDLELKKVENLQKALELPKISEMSTKQLQEFDSLLSQYKFGDEFLGARKIQTIDRTPLKGVKTYREAKEQLAQTLSKKYGKTIKPEDMKNLTGDWDDYRWDTLLAEKNPFYRLVVENVNSTLIEGESSIIEIQEKVNELMKRAHKGRGVANKLIPTDEKIINYLESSNKEEAKKGMTPAEVDAAEYMRNYFNKGLDYLYEQKALGHSRFEDVYYPHMQRGFLEAVKTSEGTPMKKIKEGVKALIQKQKLAKSIIDILDQKTGQILPMDKYFKYVQTREGNMVPSKNIGKVFLEYVRMLETKKALDRVIPEVMTYVDVLTPRTFTRTGLEKDDKLKTFVTQYINNKKGRKIKFGASQGSKPDIVLKALSGFLSLRDLGVNLAVQLGSNAGAQGGVFTLLGPLNYAKGLARYRSVLTPRKLATGKVKKYKDILDQSKSFTGRNPWTEMADISQDIGSKAFSSMFVLFRDAVVRANQIGLLGSLTKEEIATGKISAERLAQLKLKFGRWLPMERAESLAGSTSTGKAITKYKTWALVIANRALKNTAAVIKQLGSAGKSGVLGDFKSAGNKLKDTAKAQEFRELVNAAIFTSFVSLIAFAVADQQDDKKDQSFVQKMKSKLISDGLSFVAAINPDTLLSAPRLLGFMKDVSTSLYEIVKADKYKMDGKGYKKGDLKGFNKLKNTLKPNLIKTIQDSFTSKSSSGLKLKKGSKPLPKLKLGSNLKLKTKMKKLPKLPKLKKLPPIEL